MGQTLIQLAKSQLRSDLIFKNRFVVEICEKVHTHYKNIRFVNSMHDWVNVAKGYVDALDRWKKRGCPGPNKANHIELCRKKIINESENRDLLVNLNSNLYKHHEGQIFSEGARLSDDKYIHLKIGDIRIELTLDQFEDLTDVIVEANKRLKNSGHDAVLQTT